MFAGKRPREYIDRDARKLINYIAQIDRLVVTLGQEYGFTEEARRQIRGNLQRIINDPYLSLGRKALQAVDESEVFDQTRVRLQDK
tara:strand:- start:1468 stop:1725 length:258 start_codon:yes stop_codon:yes gene_type:complete